MCIYPVTWSFLCKGVEGRPAWAVTASLFRPRLRLLLLLLLLLRRRRRRRLLLLLLLRLRLRLRLLSASFAPRRVAERPFVSGFSTQAALRRQPGAGRE